MKNNYVTVVFIGSLLLSVVGCTQLPTEKQNVADLRAQIAFKVDSERISSARVFIDGLEVGTVADYLDGKSSLRILSGMHLIRVATDKETVLEEKFYIGDGVSRSFVLR